MNWTLTSGATAFEIANGIDRLARISDRPDSSLAQQTQESQRVRAEWITAFPDRASRAYSISIPVVFPECASLDDAAVQALLIPAQCPKGGTLTMQHGAQSVVYAQAWITGITVTPQGIRNVFTFNLRAVDPDTSLSLLAAMNAAYKANLNASPFSITGLTGGTSGKLDALITTDVAIGFKGELFFLLGSNYVTKTFQLVTTSTAATVTGGDGSENTDPNAGSLIIHPDDYNVSSNDKVWLEVL